MASRVGVKDAPVIIGQNDRRAQAIQGLAEDFGLAAREVDHLGDKHGSSEMRCQKARPATDGVVDDAVPRVTEHAEHGRLAGRLLQRDADEIDQALRLRPFAVEASPEETRRRA